MAIKLKNLINEPLIENDFTGQEDGELYFSITGLRDFIGCRRRAYWAHYKHYKPRAVPDFWTIGGIWHSVMESYYRSEMVLGPSIKTIRSIVNSSAADLAMTEWSGKLDQLEAIMRGMLLGYHKKYKQDDKNWDILGIETKFRVQFNPAAYFTGRWDLLIHIPYGDKKGIWLVDHKALSSLSRISIDTVQMDLQFLGYFYSLMMSAKQMLGSKHPRIRGIMWNVALKTSIRQRKNESRDTFIHRIGDVYKEEIDSKYYREWVIVSTKKLKAFQKQFMFMVDELMRISLRADDQFLRYRWYQDATRCYQFGRCPYLPICKKGLKRSAGLYRVERRMI